MLLSVLGLGFSAVAGIHNAWDDEDEEFNWYRKSPRNLWDDEDEEFNWFQATSADKLKRASGAPGPMGEAAQRRYATRTTYDPAQGFVPEKPRRSVSMKPSAAIEPSAYSSADKWARGIKNVFWENYRGNNVRIEVMRNNSDIKEMRLKFIQSSGMIADPDGTVVDMLNSVADQVMKNTCGRKASQAVVLYERPSVEFIQQTSYDAPEVAAAGDSLREYGFRCIY
jgi:hypothetical protein